MEFATRRDIVIASMDGRRLSVMARELADQVTVDRRVIQTVSFDLKNISKNFANVFVGIEPKLFFCFLKQEDFSKFWKFFFMRFEPKFLIFCFLLREASAHKTFYLSSRRQMVQEDHVHLLYRRRALLLAVRHLHLLLAPEQLPADAKIAKLVCIQFGHEWGRKT